MRTADLLRCGALALLYTPVGTVCSQSLERQIVDAAGGVAQAGNLNLEYSFGDLVVNTTLAPGAPFTQGFQQAPRTPAQAIPDPVVGVPTAYPNPTADAVRVDWGGNARGMATVDVYDALGQRLRRDRVPLAQPYRCDLAACAVGHYFIRCVPDHGRVMTVAVQKGR